MLELIGKYTKAVVMTDYADEETIRQIYSFINQEIFKDAQIVIMPDCHYGAGTVIGFTMPLKNFVIPNMIGVDIGCGIEAYKIGNVEIDFKAFDNYLRKNMPAGFEVRKNKPPVNHKDRHFQGKIASVLEHLKTGYQKKYSADPTRTWNSIGTLGGGNHFIEINEDQSGSKWLVIHTGSRHFGKLIAEYYQRRARDFIEKYNIRGVQQGLEYLPLDYEYGLQYIEDMKIAQEYASLNRKIIAGILLGFFKGVEAPEEINNSLYDTLSIKSIHNYINFQDKIIRKGAITAQSNESLIIPLNMKDGVIIGKGKSNPEWNFSAPHGAGRILSRNKAKSSLSLDQFKKVMSGVWTSCVSKDTLDESPMAYKPKSEILNRLGETVDIEFIMKPIYNFKAGGE